MGWSRQRGDARARLAAAGLAWIALVPASAQADGAIAIGLPSDVAMHGVAVGTSWNYTSQEAARARALEECLSFPDASADTRKLCKVIQTFVRECVAIALDPDAGTPGFGWAVALPQSAAEDAAMQACRMTAGASRQKFCRVTTTRCDGQ
jgi:hypothetical protein